MSRLKRHQHVFQTVEGELVTSTLIPFGDVKLEAITLASIHFLIGVPPSAASAILYTYGVETVSRHGQEWVVVDEASRAFNLRSRE